MLRFDGRLGFGKDGTVWKTHKSTALKVFCHTGPFERELAAYSRLAECRAFVFNKHRAPKLRRADHELLAIEMTIVRPPFVLDFASAYLDGTGPVFPEDVMAEWLADKQEEFGDNWPKAAGVLSALNRIGIHMTDVHPGNIKSEGD